MEERTKGLVNKGLPWSRDVRWQIVAIEAVILIAVGAYMVIDTDTASEVVLQIIGVGLLGTSLLLTLATLRSAEGGLGFFDSFRAGVGATCGAIATASWWSDYIQNHAVRIILGWGLITWSVLHIAGLIVVRGRGNFRMSTVVIALLSLVLGVILLTGDDVASVNRVRSLGVIALVFGVLLAALAYYLYTRANDGGSARPTAAGQ